MQIVIMRLVCGLVVKPVVVHLGRQILKRVQVIDLLLDWHRIQDGEHEDTEWEHLLEDEVERQTIFGSRDLFRVENAVDDSNCLFYSLLLNNNTCMTTSE